MVQPNVIGGFLGGALIDCAALSLPLLNGGIAGVSGILRGAITSDAITSKTVFKRKGE